MRFFGFMQKNAISVELSKKNHYNNSRQTAVSTRKTRNAINDLRM